MCMRLFPSPATQEKYIGKVNQLEKIIGRVIPKFDMQVIAGMYNCIARFFSKGTNASQEVYVCLQLDTRTDLDMKVVWGRGYDK